MQCPFCPPANSLLSQPLYVDEDVGAQILVVPNAFPLVRPSGSATFECTPMRCSHPALGHHEVAIESGEHDASFSNMPRAQVVRVLKAWRTRGLELLALNDVEAITIFKNAGQNAGGTLVHPHSQIIATAACTPRLEMFMRKSRAWRYRYGRCAICAGLEGGGAYVVVAHTPHFILGKPYVGRQDWDLHILPADHRFSFFLESDTALADLAGLLQRTLRGLATVLGDYSYNLMLTTASKRCQSGDWAKAVHWRLELVPRTAVATGFELATGLDVNTIEQVDAAATLADAINGLDHGQ